jgi:hypothetical protein
MTRIYNNIFHSKVLQNVPKLGIFGPKRNHLATLGGVSFPGIRTSVTKLDYLI